MRTTKLSDTIDGTGLHGYTGHERARAGNRYQVTHLQAGQLTSPQPCQRQHHIAIATRHAPVSLPSSSSGAAES
jgi:hypothetical protein